jgi:predicted ribosomally synthesized peptide with nif11-like leader
MSKDAVLAFRNKVIESADLQDQVRAAVKAGGGPALVALGKTNGHEFTGDDVREVYAPLESGELSESQLEGVAGGANNLTPFEMQMVSFGGGLFGSLGGSVAGSLPAGSLGSLGGSGGSGPHK